LLAETLTDPVNLTSKCTRIRDYLLSRENVHWCHFHSKRNKPLFKYQVLLTFVSLVPWHCQSY